MNKPGNFGGFHIINIDDTIEIHSDKLINDLNDDNVKPLLESSFDNGGICRIYLFNGIGLSSILFEIVIPTTMTDSAVHYHIPPNSLEIFRNMYYDLIVKS